MDEFLAARCPCCYAAAEANTRHVRLGRRSGAQVKQHQLLVHALSRTLRAWSFVTKWKAEPPPRNRICAWALLSRQEDSDMLRHQSVATKQYYSTSCMRAHKWECTCGQAALTETDQLLPLLRHASAITRLVRDRQVSFDERSYKLATLAVDCFGRLGQEGSDLIDQVAASIIRGTDGLSLLRKGACKERLFQVIYVATQVAILRRVNTYRLALRDHQAQRGREELAGGLRPVA